MRCVGQSGRSACSPQGWGGGGGGGGGGRAPTSPQLSRAPTSPQLTSFTSVHFLSAQLSSKVHLINSFSARLLTEYSTRHHQCVCVCCPPFFRPLIMVPFERYYFENMVLKNVLSKISGTRDRILFRFTVRPEPVSWQTAGLVCFLSSSCRLWKG